ncbi:MAG: S26 family signal peptidase [Phycisphaerales bacterium]
MADTITQTSRGKGTKADNGAVGIKETITSLVIAFMLAFLFRGFVIEGFQIPTGSMAPTLLGKHIRFTSPYNGYDWTTGPWTYADRGRQQPVRQQDDIRVTDPMSGLTIDETNRRLASGDRVFVLKYLPFLQSPKRWDVVVFKNPGSHENYIKRLVGLPGEQVIFVDGDVFARKFVEGTTERSGWASWAADGWAIQRKPERVQREMFQDVFDSRYAPIEIEPGYRSPFTGEGDGWDGVKNGSRYVYAGGAGSTALVWNDSRPITDANAYNQTWSRFNLFAEPGGTGGNMPFPDSDVALSLDIECVDGPIVVSPILEARGMGFRGVVDGDSGVVSVEIWNDETVPDADGSAWETVDSGEIKAFEQGEFHHVEFWHVDQALWLFVDGELVCGGREDGGYSMTPAQRASAATGRPWESLREDKRYGDGVTKLGVFAYPGVYRKPGFRWMFSGGNFALTNVSVRRDIAYQVNPRNVTQGGHPNYFCTLTDEEYFMCGDNSANSLDSRLWRPGTIDPWVESMIDDHVGAVNKDLVVGKAFMVYFPAPLDGGLPMKQGRKFSVDFGRMRWIW